MPDISMPVPLDDIDVPSNRRPVDSAAVSRLAKSIDELGLRHPITVRRHGDRYRLVAGLHRMEAVRKLGRDHINAIIASMTNVEARMWEIAENLHRADLTKQQRADQVAEWVKLCNERVSAQIGRKPSSGGRPEGGMDAAARELGIDRHEVQRSVKIASLAPEAKEAARESGMDDNQTVLLKAASEATPEAQIATIRSEAELRAEKTAEKKAQREQREAAPPMTQAAAKPLRPFDPGTPRSGANLETLVTFLREHVSETEYLTPDYTTGDLMNDLDNILGHPIAACPDMPDFLDRRRTQ